MSIRNRITQFLWTLVAHIRCSKAGILLGRITSGSGAAEEIELGEGLAFEGGKLKSTVTGGTTDYNDLDNKPTLGAAAALDASEGGNDTADAGKVVKFTSSGSITSSSGILILDGSVSIKDSSSGFTLDLSPASLTDDRTQNLPDKSGTVAMTSDIPETSTGGNGAADAGKVVKFTSSGSITCSSGILILDGSVSIKDSSSGFTLDLSPALLTDDRTWDLPDKSGTVAMTSDIPTTASQVGAVGLTGDETVAGAKTWSGDASFTSSTRPTSAGTGTPAATSLITLTDADSIYPRFFSAVKIATTHRVSTTVLADDPHMVIASVPVGRYRVELCFQTYDNSNSGFKWAIGGTATMAAASRGRGATIASLAGSTWGQITLPLGGESIAPWVNVTRSAWIIFEVSVTVAGSVTFQWAQNTSYAGNTPLLEGSFITLTKIG